MSVSFGGIGDIYATFMADTGLTANTLVKMSDNNEVTACAEGDRFIGICTEVSADGYATVQLKGFSEMPYTGSDPVIGALRLVAGSDNEVSVDSGDTVSVTDTDEAAQTITTYTGMECLVVSVDTVNNTVGFIM